MLWRGSEEPETQTHTKRAFPWLTVVSEPFGEHTPPFSCMSRTCLVFQRMKGLKDTGRQNDVPPTLAVLSTGALSRRSHLTCPSLIGMQSGGQALSGASLQHSCFWPRQKTSRHGLRWHFLGPGGRIAVPKSTCACSEGNQRVLGKSARWRTSVVRLPRESFPQDLYHPEFQHWCVGCSVSGFWPCLLVLPCSLFLLVPCRENQQLHKRQGAWTSHLRKDSLRWGRGSDHILGSLSSIPVLAFPLLLWTTGLVLPTTIQSSQPLEGRG